jgi:hypothetical protein
VPEQPPFFRRLEDRRRTELPRAADVVHERGCEEKIGAQARMQL